MVSGRSAVTPFRWNLAKREQLGRLVTGEPSATYPEFLDDLQHCSARILTFCDDSYLVFVGRSPESIFDHLSGLLSNTSWRDRCRLLNLSMSLWHDERRLDERRVVTDDALRAQLTAVGLSPADMLGQSRPVAFVDVAYQGRTFTLLNKALRAWWRELRADDDALRNRLRFIGITSRTKTSPKTWRWQQHAPWTRQYRARTIKNVSIPGRLWEYLAEIQEKVTPSNPPWRWNTGKLAHPPRGEQHRRALRLALHLYEQGTSKTTQRSFARLLVLQSGMNQEWYRKLVMELRRPRA